MTGYHPTNETLSAYEHMGRQVGPAERQRAHAVFTLIMDDLDETGSTGEMVTEFARVVNFVLANKRVTQMLSESSGYSPAEVAEIWTRDRSARGAAD